MSEDVKPSGAKWGDEIESKEANHSKLDTCPVYGFSSREVNKKGRDRGWLVVVDQERCMQVQQDNFISVATIFQFSGKKHFFCLFQQREKSECFAGEMVSGHVLNAKALPKIVAFFGWEVTQMPLIFTVLF